MKRTSIIVAAVSICLMLLPGAAVADDDELLGIAALKHHNMCSDVPGHTRLTAILKSVVGLDNAGLGNDMWAAVVNRDGYVCAVTFSGSDRYAQWGISRLVSAQKANTVNLLSLSAGTGGIFPGITSSTANLWAGMQPGGGLFGLDNSHPVDTDVAYRGNPAQYGKSNDPLVGRRIGGVIVIGGGLALHDSDGVRVGGLGLSGDSACSDHIQAWKVRDALGLDNVPFGPSPTGDDNIIFDLVDDAGGNPESPSGFGHPTCLFEDAERAAVEALPIDYPIGPNP